MRAAVQPKTSSTDMRATNAQSRRVSADIKAGRLLFLFVLFLFVFLLIAAAEGALHGPGARELHVRLEHTLLLLRVENQVTMLSFGPAREPRAAVVEHRDRAGFGELEVALVFADGIEQRAHGVGG